MALTAEQERAAWKWFLDRRRDLGLGPVTWTKTTLRAAATSTDGWIADNAGAYATSLGGTGFQGANSTADEKALLFTAVALARRDLIT